MYIDKQSIEVLDEFDNDILKKLERAGRICYKSEDRITEESSKEFIRNIIAKGHESVLEHESISVKAVTTRSVSHQLVRHRIASYSQESQRYVNYKRHGDIGFIMPYQLETTEQIDSWLDAMLECERAYFKLLHLGVAPETAREVLPNSTRTEIIITMNIRSWRHFFKLRLDRAADPKIRELARLIHDAFTGRVDILFEGVY